MTNYDEIEANFVEEARFAKLVSTPRGHAILIAGAVLEVSGPPSIGSHIIQPDFAAALVKALRNPSSPELASASTTSAAA
jgi:hypothetical protein